MNELNKPRGTYADYKAGSETFSRKQFVFELIKKNPQAGTNSLGNPIAGMRDKLTGKTMEYPLSVPIALTGTIFFKELKTGKTYPRRIRYAEGENEIFVDLQTSETEDFKHKEVRANFVKGRFYVDGANSTLLDFIMNWDMNESKDNRDAKKTPLFRLLDTSKQAEKVRKDDAVVFDVLKWCYTGDWKKEVQPLANAIFTEEQMNRSSEEIRHDLVVIAKSNPVSFKSMLENPKMERLITIKSAIQNDILIVDASMNTLCWIDSPSVPISQAAPGKEVIDDFINKSFSTTGEIAYKAILEALYPSELGDVNDVVNTKKVYKAPIVKGAIETDEELTTIVRDAVEKGIIEVKKNIWWKFKGESCNGEKRMVDKLRDNEIMLSILKKNILEWEPSEEE